MTAPQKSAIVTGLVTLLLGTALIAATQQVILRPEFSLHNAEVNAKFSETYQAIEEVKGITLDLLCSDHPAHRRCK